MQRDLPGHRRPFAAGGGGLQRRRCARAGAADPGQAGNLDSLDLRATGRTRQPLPPPGQGIATRPAAAPGVLGKPVPGRDRRACPGRPSGGSRASPGGAPGRRPRAHSHGRGISGRGRAGGSGPADVPCPAPDAAGRRGALRSPGGAVDPRIMPPRCRTPVRRQAPRRTCGAAGSDQPPAGGAGQPGQARAAPEGWRPVHLRPRR